MDTGWESQITYDYLDEIEKHVGKIHRIKASIKVKPEHAELVQSFEDRLGFESPFIRAVFYNRAFPSSMMKWCTRQLKIEPISKFLKDLDSDVVNLVGIRREESLRRSKMTEWEFNEGFDCWTWRPLIGWTLKDVIDIHHRFNIIPNRPCIMAKKQEIKLLPPDRIDLIRDLEAAISDLREKQSTFFSRNWWRTPQMPIDDVRDWAATSRGGKQFELFDTSEPPCRKWGLCHV